MRRKDIADFLNTILVNKKYIFLSYWSFVHLLLGVLFFVIWDIFYDELLLGLFIWLIVQIAWEIIEFLLAWTTHHKLFNETFVDAVWDVIVGTVGYTLMRLIYII